MKFPWTFWEIAYFRRIYTYDQLYLAIKGVCISIQYLYILTPIQLTLFMHTSVSSKLAVHASCSISPKAEPEKRAWLHVVYWGDDPRKQEWGFVKSEMRKWEKLTKGVFCRAPLAKWAQFPWGSHWHSLISVRSASEPFLLQAPGWSIYHGLLLLWAR